MEENNMMTDYEPMNPIELVDDEGKSHFFDQLDYLKCEGNEYVALVPIRQEDSSDEEDGLLIIMKVVSKNGSDSLSLIEDDAELNKISTLFIERLSEDYDIDNSDEDVEVIS